MDGRPVAPVLGVSYSTLMRAVAENRSPVAFIRIGSRVKFLTADLRRVLGLDPPAPNGNGHGATNAAPGGDAVTFDHAEVPAPNDLG